MQNYFLQTFKFQIFDYVINRKKKLTCERYNLKLYKSTSVIYVLS